MVNIATQRSRKPRDVANTHWEKVDEEPDAP